MTRSPITLQRRLLLYLLISAPLVWSVALAFSVVEARHEVNELFDTEMIRLARQIQVISPRLAPSADDPLASAVAPAEQGESDLSDLAVAVWDGHGQLLVVDREGVQLPWIQDASGFVHVDVGPESWRIYYMQAPAFQGLIASGQRVAERDELVWGLVASQLVPWLLVLPVLLVAMAWAVRQAMEPMQTVTQSLHARGANDLSRLPVDQAPAELVPLLEAMNELFARIEDSLERERRFTADAAHELRTPMAVLAAQWSVYRGARDSDERERAAAQLTMGLERASRLMEQMLSLSRLEATQGLPQARPLDWQALVEQALSDVLPLAERRQIELACEAVAPTASSGLTGPQWLGDPALMALLLRNLLDNAVRYAPAESVVTMRLGPDEVSVENDVTRPISPEDVKAWGTRFHRPEGQQESGSGLGVSIAQRIAALHGLRLMHGVVDGRVSARLTRPESPGL